MHLAFMEGLSFRLGKLTVAVVQVLLWAVFFLLLLLYTSHKWDHPLYGFLSAGLAMLSYVSAAYGNAFWLLPRYLHRGKPRAYAFFSLLFLAAVIVLRMHGEAAVLMPLHKAFYNFSSAHFSFDAITILVAFLFGALLRVFLNYLTLVQQKKEMQARHTEAELNLLKTQVQPHFLFNTLNNIYSLAQSGSPRTPEVIAKLSELMRYFLDEAPKEKLSLSTEIGFIKNYIELEQIRMRHPVCVDWNVDRQVLSASVPPMLLMPFVENVFKHGVDKLKDDNRVSISLQKSNGRLKYLVTNSVGEVGQATGSGLTNLRKRLDLLFPTAYSLTQERQNETYIALLSFPLA